MIPVGMQILILIQFVVMLPTIWNGAVAVFGLLRRKEKIPVAKKKMRFAVVICARNEEVVIARLLTSLGKQRYPINRMHVFVLADHCTDQTAEVARQFPFVTVLERHTGPTNGKGDVLSWGIDRILKEYGDSIDAFSFFDADNVAEEHFLARINDMMQAGEEIVQGNRLGGEPYTTGVTKWFAIYWMAYTCFFSYPRQKLGLSAFLTGTGFAVRRELLESGWHTSTITEDVEFSIQNCLMGHRVAFCLDALCFDEQPSQVSVMLRQLQRWCTGSFQILKQYGPLFAPTAEDGRRRLIESRESAGIEMHSTQPDAIRHDDPFTVRTRQFDNRMLLAMAPANVAGFVLNLIMTPLNLYYIPVIGVMILAMTVAAPWITVSMMLKYFYHKDPVTVRREAATMWIFLLLYSFCSVVAFVHPSHTWKRIEHVGIVEPGQGGQHRSQNRITGGR